MPVAPETRFERFLERLTPLRRHTFLQDQRWKHQSYHRVDGTKMCLRVSIECGYGNHGHARIEMLDMAPVGARQWVYLYSLPLEGSAVEQVSYVQKLAEVEDSMHDVETQLLAAAADLL